MPPPLTTDQVLALAPDAASAKSGKGLASPRSWLSCGQNEQAIWGECQGSGKLPYRTQVDLNGFSFRCSCPSRKFPCKHGLGLLLLLAAQPTAIPQADSPDWVAEWLASRAKREERREQRLQAPPAGDDPAAEERRAKAQAKTASARETKVAAGMEELGRWLRDQIREGLATAPSRAPAIFERMAARMVDAQAAGSARLLRTMAATPATDQAWQGRLLEQLARTYLLVEGYAHLAALTPAEQADLRVTLGFTQNQDELLRSPEQSDHWLILGRRIEEEERLKVQRTWLWGESLQVPALILEFAAPGQHLDRSLIPGHCLDADLVFYPTPAPLRALVQQRRAITPLTALPMADISSALGYYAQALAQSPWLERYPLCLGPIRLVRVAQGWVVHDAAGRSLPLIINDAWAWKLIARSGAQPFTLCAEWDGDGVRPLSAWVDGFVELS